MSYRNPYYDEAAGEIPIWRKRSMLERLGSNTKTAASTLLDLINVPASRLYDFTLSRPSGSGSTAGDVLEAAGLRPSKEALGGWGSRRVGATACRLCVCGYQRPDEPYYVWWRECQQGREGRKGCRDFR